jgi:hypothetical protein
MEYTHAYAIWTEIRQDHKKNRAQYVWVNRQLTQQSIDRIRHLMEAYYLNSLGTFQYEGITLNAIMEEALREAMRYRPEVFDPKTGKYLD